MKVAIVGAGAMGSLFAYLLSRPENDVWLVDIHQERVEKVRRDGLRIEGLSGQHRVQVKITTRPEEIGPVDLVIVFVKAYDTERATEDALPLIGDKTAVLTLQNGLGNVEVIGRIVGQERVVGGITSHGATVLGVGHVCHAGWGETIVGELTGCASPRLRNIVNLFNSAGIKTRITSDLEGLIWSKLLINVGINALTAITGFKNGQLLDFPETRELLSLAVEEAYRVALAEGVNIIYDDPVQKAESVCKATADNVSSMLQDVQNRKRTEVDFLNGVVVSRGEELGISTPVNRILALLVKAIERGCCQGQ